MSETIQKGWITDENGQKFAPKTLIEQAAIEITNNIGLD